MFKAKILLLIIIFLSSCASVKINGIEVKRSHRVKISKKEGYLGMASFLLGFTLSKHFIKPIKK